MKTITTEGNLRDILMVLAGAVMISFSAVFVKLAHVGPTVSAFYRMAIGGFLLMVIAVVTGKAVRFPLKALSLMALCAFCFVWDLTVWHHSIFYVGPGLATILANFQVFFLAGIGFLFYKERVNIRYVVSVPLALLGLGLLILPRNMAAPQPHFYLGVGLGLLTALAYSAYLLSLRTLQARYTTISAFFVIAVISLLTALGIGLEVIVTGNSFAIPDTQTYLALIAYGIMGQVLGWVLISKGIGNIEASRAGLILLLQPTLSFVWDILFFGHPTGLSDLAGAALAIFAIYLGSTSRQAR